MPAKFNILVSQPNFYTGSIYLPYLWAALKTYCNNFDSEIRRNYNWLPPIYENKLLPEALGDYELEKIDILCLSCYVWSSEFNYKVARKVKQSNPKCLVIAGGPDIDYRDRNFFSRHPQVDIVVRQEGEIPLSKILIKYLNNERDFKDIPGLIFRDNSNNIVVNTGKYELHSDFETSLYLEEREYFKKLSQKHNDVRVIWETNRGCPYSCVFCDWGSNTNAKIRRIPMTRLFKELEWFAYELKPDYFFLSDANFGILPRDLEIVDKLVELKKETGFPNVLIYFPAKNNVERIIRISKRLYNANIMPYHTLGLQHTDRKVLGIMNRQDISLEKQKFIITSLLKDGIPTVIQLIMGTPGDTLETWKRVVTDVMEIGAHEEYRTNIFNLLRGSRAWQAEFRKKWGIKTVSRSTSAVRRDKNDNSYANSKSEYIVATKSFSRDNWVEMYLYDIMAQAFHNGAVTRFLAIYLRLTHDIPYKNFYDALFEKLCCNEHTFIGALFKKCKAHLHVFANAPGDAAVFEEMAIDDLPNSAYLFKPEEYVLFKLLTNFARVWEELQGHLVTTYGYISRLGSIIDFQKEIIITPQYDCQRGKSLKLEHDWLEYFKKARTRAGPATPAAILGMPQQER